MNKYIGYPVLVLIAALMAGCGSSSSSTSTSSTSTTPTTYSTTTSKGDFAEWTINGSTLSANWDVEDTMGAINYTYNISANCGSADSYGVSSCTVSTSSCTDGVLSCTSATPPATGSTFQMMAVPGVALFVNTGSQLHIGFAKDSSACSADGTGDYTMIYTGLGGSENFGVYRSDSNFINVTHADFGFDTPDANITQSVAYRTTNGGGTGTQTLSDGGCTNGVRIRTANGKTMRLMATASGLFVLDFPAGQGGLLSFKTSNAATLADFANKSFGGISFPDNASPQLVKVTSGPVNGNQVDFTATTGSTSQSINIKALATPATMTNPPYPDFTVAPPGYSYSALSGSSDYPAPASIPGLFKLDNLNDSGRVVLAAMKYNGKIIAFGMVYNYRTTKDTDPATGNPFPYNGLFNTGNFLLFEK